jgi:hypothetical protein
MGGGNPYSQTATFEGKVHEDSLPAMPSWDTAQERRVEVVEEVKPGVGEAHELEKLSPTGQAAANASPMAGFAAAPTQPQRAMGGASAPHSPYGDERDPFLQGGQTQGVMHADSQSGYRGTSPQPQYGNGSAGAVGYGFANHRPGGLQNQQPSYNSYQDSQSDFYAGGGHADDRSRGYNNSQSRPDASRQYSQQTLPAYDDNRGGYGAQPAMPRHEDYQQDQGRQYGQQDNYSSQYDPRREGRDPNAGAYRSFSPAYGANKPMNGSWKDI